MGVLERDPEATATTLARWLHRVAGVERPEVAEVSIPGSTGWSNETVMFEATWGAGDARRRRRLVARIAPSDHRVFPDETFLRQHAVMHALAERSDVPMARVRWLEVDPAWFGQPFWIMDRVDGDIATDAPSYAGQGWLHDASPDRQERAWVPPILEGRVAWCQLFSEPGAGSDLAGLTTRARRDGDRWIISGQKVWSSQAREADFGMLLARTDLEVPKHKGISWFALPLDQSGVTIRPLREMTGQAVFNEVFLDEAECDAADLIGGEGNGWQVTQTTLHFERTGIGAGGSHAGFPNPGPKGGMLRRRAGDAAVDEPPHTKLTLGYPDVVALAQKHGRAADPLVRQELARLYATTEIGRWNASRGQAEAQRGGGQSVASTGKLSQTRIVKLAARLGVDILGADALLAGADGVEDGAYAEAFVFSPASSIYGGTDEIQRNIIAERTLGLPREPAPDRDRPFGDVLRERDESWRAPRS